MNTFQKLSKASNKHGETNDCSVKAIAAVANLPYSCAHEALAKVGRRKGKGPSWLSFYQCMKNLNLWYESVPFQGKTVRTLQRSLPKTGRYIVATRGHVLAIVNGEVMDWTAGRLHRILKVYKISF